MSFGDRRSVLSPSYICGKPAVLVFVESWVNLLEIKVVDGETEFRASLAYHAQWLRSYREQARTDENGTSFLGSALIPLGAEWTIRFFPPITPLLLTYAILM